MHRTDNIVETGFCLDSHQNRERMETIDVKSILNELNDVRNRIGGGNSRRRLELEKPG